MRCTSVRTLLWSAQKHLARGRIQRSKACFSRVVTVAIVGECPHLDNAESALVNAFFINENEDGLLFALRAHELERGLGACRRLPDIGAHEAAMPRPKPILKCGT